MSTMPEAAAGEDELVLEPAKPVSPVSPAQAASSMRVDPDTKARIASAVNNFVDSIVGLDAHSPEFGRKVRSITRMGNEEIRRSAEASNRFLDRPTAALQNGPITQGSQVSSALLSLRKEVEGLDPSRHLGRRRGLFERLPIGNQVNDYFRKYQSAQSSIEAIVTSLYRGQDELMRDNAALEKENEHLWAMKGRLEQYAYMASTLDESLSTKVADLERNEPEKARALKEDALFYIRQ